MGRAVRAAVLSSVVAAFAVFAYVQDRTVASGAARYAVLQREAMAGRRQPVTIDEIMRPAVSHSVRAGLLWGSVVLVSGIGTASVVGRRRRT